MNAILQTQPKTTFKIKNEELTYEMIQQAIDSKHTNRFLQGIVSTCKANPSTVVIIVYKAFSDSVLMIFGNKPTAVIVEGDKVKKNLSGTSEKGYLYVFTHTI
tara:strand:- start:810 stop:1118 length:309 start_codon:yes stop_codon:yes gene_type:complete